MPLVCPQCQFCSACFAWSCHPLCFVYLGCAASALAVPEGVCPKYTRPLHPRLNRCEPISTFISTSSVSPPTGVSYGLTQQLYNFWRKAGFDPLYLRQSPSDTTGEHTCIMVAPLEHPDVAGGAGGWLAPLVADFRGRLMSLLAGAFRGMPAALALSLLDPRLTVRVGGEWHVGRCGCGPCDVWCGRALFCVCVPEPARPGTSWCWARMLSGCRFVCCSGCVLCGLDRWYTPRPCYGFEFGPFAVVPWGRCRPHWFSWLLCSV